MRQVYKIIGYTGNSAGVLPEHIFLHVDETLIIPTPADFISADADNAASIGSDGKIFVAASGGGAGEINIGYTQSDDNGLQIFTNTSTFQTQLPLPGAGGSEGPGVMTYPQSIKVDALRNNADTDILLDNKFDNWLDYDYHIAFPVGGAATIQIVKGMAYTGGGVLRAIAATNDFTRSQRMAFVTNGTPNSAQASTRQLTGYLYRDGGYKVEFKVGASTGAALLTGKYFAGLTAPNNLNPTPQDYVNCIGISKPEGMTNWHIIHNDASGSAVLINCGSDFAANTDSTVVIKVTIQTVPTGVKVTVKKMGTSIVFESTITTEIPASNFANTFSMMSTNAGTDITGFDWFGTVIKVGAN